MSFHTDPLFKGATRPALYMGVPLMPFLLNAGIFVLLSVYFTFLFLPLAVPVFLVMRQMTKSDDQKFRLLGLKARFRLRPFFTGSLDFWKSNAYSPIPFKVRKP
jgi:type IV secretion system protein VirB3